jgi:hypothetical protein
MEVQDRVRLLRQLVGESLYTVDERAVADTILLRSRLKLALPDQEFRSEHRGPAVRSFRRDRGARSFRLASSTRLRALHH